MLMWSFLPSYSHTRTDGGESRIVFCEQAGVAGNLPY